MFYPMATKVRQIKGHGHVIQDARLSPNGKLLATASLDKTMIIWTTDVRTSAYFMCI
jgi:WD40 repeat protein